MLKIFSRFWKLYFNYVLGITKYVRNNDVGDGAENLWESVLSEWDEFCVEIKLFNIKDAFLEFCDVCHALIKYFIITYLPKWFYCSYFCWVLVCPLVLPCTLKLGKRHKMFNCIRNHKNPNNCNHKCDFN